MYFSDSGVWQRTQPSWGRIPGLLHFFPDPLHTMHNVGAILDHPPIVSVSTTRPICPSQDVLSDGFWMPPTTVHRPPHELNEGEIGAGHDQEKVQR